MKNKITFYNLMTPSVIISVILLVLSIIGMIMCLFSENHNLDILLTISGGVFSGIIMYWLSNIRQTYVRELEHELALMIKLRDLCNQNARELDYVINHKEIIDDFEGFFLTAFNKMEEAQSILFDNMSYELFCKCCYDKENPIDYSVTNDLLEQYQNVGDRETEILTLIYKLSQMQKSTSEKVRRPLEENKSKINVCYKFGL